MSLFEPKTDLKDLLGDPPKTTKWSYGPDERTVARKLRGCWIVPSKVSAIYELEGHVFVVVDGYPLDLGRSEGPETLDKITMELLGGEIRSTSTNGGSKKS